jgi:hypothetical protein
MEYFPVKIRVNYKQTYLIWCSDFLDKVFSVNGITPTFSSVEKLSEFSKLNKIEFNSEEAFYDFDKIKLWCENPTPKIQAESFLNTWNFFGDLAASYPTEHQQFELLTQKYIKQYNKLFYGCNLKCINSSSKKYRPEWLPQELLNIRAVFLYGLELCKKHFRANNMLN